MGVKLLAEPSASDTEMLVMDFDGWGCVLASGVVDGVRDERFVEVAEGALRAQQGAFACEPWKELANQVARLAAFRAK